jgi:exopolysaccharide biosynthesis polyprenyl glycosylphosphotransferase
MKGLSHAVSRGTSRDDQHPYDDDSRGAATAGSGTGWRRAQRRLRVVPRRDLIETVAAGGDPLEMLDGEIEEMSPGSGGVVTARPRLLVASGEIARRHRRSERLLVTGDLVALAGSLLVALAAGLGRGDPAALVVLAAAIAIFGGSTAARMYGMYARDAGRTDHTTADDLPHVLHVSLLTSFGVSAVLATSTGVVRIGPVLVLFVCMLGLMFVCRAGARSLDRRQASFIQNTVIVGAGSIGQLLALKLMNRPVHGYRLAGFVDDDAPDDIEATLGDVPVLGRVDELPELVARHEIDRVIVAFTRHSHERTVELLRSLKRIDVYVDVVPRLFDSLGPTAELHSIDGLPLIGYRRAERSRLSRAAKRVIDVVVASVGTVILSPWLCVLALIVRLDSPGPALYSAERIGRDGRPFRQLKFRTMHSEFCDGERYGGEGAKAAFERLLGENDHLRRQFEQTHKLSDDPRVTRIGRFLRATSLDELPQLINVIRGDLSLVGPRPITEAELERYGDGVDELLSVPPGLTGFWQISGRSALSYEERVRLDLAYVKAWSLRLDLLILLKSANLLTNRTRAV